MLNYNDQLNRVLQFTFLLIVTDGTTVSPLRLAKSHVTHGCSLAWRLRALTPRRGKYIFNLSDQVLEFALLQFVPDGADASQVLNHSGDDLDDVVDLLHGQSGF